MQLKNLLVIALLALGCGVADEGYDDIGEAEEAFTTAGASPGFMTGIRAGTAAVPQQCSTTQGSTDSCFFRSSRSVNFCVDPNSFANSGERGLVRNALADQVDAAKNQMQAVGAPPAGNAQWVLFVRASGATCAAGGADVVLRKASIAPSLGANMNGYMQFVAGSLPIAVTESFPGTFFKMSAGTSCNIDYVDILNRGANAAEDDMLLRRSTGMCLSNSLGAGLTNGTNQDFATQSTVAPFNGFTQFTPGQACRLQRFNVTTTTNYVFGGAQCPND